VSGTIIVVVLLESVMCSSKRRPAPAFDEAAAAARNPTWTMRNPVTSNINNQVPNQTQSDQRSCNALKAAHSALFSIFF